MNGSNISVQRRIALSGVLRNSSTIMPVRFISSEQERRYGKFTDKLSPEQLARYFHLDDADKEFLRSFRESYMRFGVAVQIGTVRFLGTFLENVTETPQTIQDSVASQLGISAG